MPWCEALARIRVPTGDTAHLFSARRHRCRSGLSRCLWHPDTLTGPQFPGAILLLPDLQDADLGAGALAVGLTFGRPRMACDRIVSDDGDGVIRQGEGFEDGFSGDTNRLSHP